MEPTEHELTVAVNEAARHLFARVSDGALQPSDFDHADPMHRLRCREAVAPVVHDALRALPDRAESAAAVAVAAFRTRLEMIAEDECCAETVAKILTRVDP